MLNLKQLRNKIMSKRLSFVLVLLLLLSSKISAQSVNMLDSDAEWIYLSEKSNEDGHKEKVLYRFFTKELTRQIDNSVKADIYMSKHVVDDDSMLDNIENIAFDNDNSKFMLSFLEFTNTGMVTVDISEYINYIKSSAYGIFEDIEITSPFIYTSFIEPGYDIKDLCLYDFNNYTVGEPVCSGLGVIDPNEIPYITEICDTIVNNGISRKMYILDNGMKLVEGIGCINSPGMLLSWLNFNVDDSNNITNLLLYRKKGTTNIKNLHSVQGEDKIFDIQGKQLDRLEKGLNIIKSADGKTVKVMK